MSNFIISFLILADKFFGKLKATPVKVLVYFFAFGGGFYLFVQWNTVPTLSTEVVVNSYRTTTNDKASISLKLQKNIWKKCIFMRCMCLNIPEEPVQRQQPCRIRSRNRSRESVLTAY